MNLNVIRTIQVRGEQRGLPQLAESIDGVTRAHKAAGRAAVESVTMTESASRRQFSYADAFARRNRQMIMDAHTLAAANDNVARSWQAIGRAQSVMLTRFGSTVYGNEGTSWLFGSPHMRAFEARLKQLGLENSVVTGMLKKTEDGFIQLQNPASQAANAIGQVSSGLDVMVQAADPAAESISSFSKQLSLLGAGGVILGTIAALRKAIDDLIAVADRAQDTRLGATLLMGLEAGAIAARVPVEQLNTAINHFTELSKKTADDAKSFHTALSNVSPALSEAFKSAPTQGERLRIIAEGLRLARGEVQRYQLAQQALGTDNDRMIAMFVGGRVAIDGFVKRAQDLGIVMDEAFVKRAAEAQAQLATLTTLLQQRLTIALVEAFQALSKWIGVSSAAGGAIPALTQVFAFLDAAIKDVAYDLNNLARAWEAFKTIVMTPSGQDSGLTFSRDVLGPLGEIFDRSPEGQLKRQIAVYGQDAGKTFADEFYDAISGVFGKRPVPVPGITVNADGAAAGSFKGRGSPSEIDATRTAFDRAVDSANRHIAVMKADAAAVGLGAGAQAELRMRAILTEAAMRDGADAVEKHKDKIDELSRKAGEAAKELEKLRQTERVLESFFSTFVSGFVEGKNVVDALAGALGAVGSQMQSIGTQSLSKGFTGLLAGQGFGGFDPMSLAIGAAGIGLQFVSKLFGESEAEKEHKKAVEAWQGMANEFESFIDTLQGAKMGEIARQWAEAGERMQRLVEAAAAAGDWGSVTKLQTEFEKMRERTAREFVATFDDVLEGLKQGVGLGSGFLQAMNEAKATVDQLKGFIDDARQSFGRLAGELVRNTGIWSVSDAAAANEVALAKEAVRQYLMTMITGAEPLTDVQQKLITLKAVSIEVATALKDLGFSAAEVSTLVQSATQAIAQGFTDDLQRQINDALGQGHLNEIADLLKTVEQRRNDLDALIAAGATGIDVTLLDRFLEVQAQKIVDGAGLAGEAFDALILQFPQLTGVIHESTRALEEQRSAMNAAARSIVDYINGINAGASSTLSPQARLDAASATFNAQLQLAQAGNVDALSRITQDAEGYRTALQAMFGSSAGYQQGWAQIVDQLLALPAVQTSDDPVVLAMLDVLNAIEAGNSELASIESSSADTKHNTFETVSRLDESIGRLDTTILRLGDVITNLAAVFTSIGDVWERIGGSNDLLDQIRQLNNTSIEQLALLRSTFENAPVNIAGTTYTHGTETVTVGGATLQNSMLEALNKIAWNTYRIERNTGTTANWVSNGVYTDYNVGIYGSGGWIGGNSHSQGGTMIEAERNEFMIRRQVALANADWLPRFNATGQRPAMPSFVSAGNDNGATVSELRALRSELAAHRRENGALLARIAQLEERNADASEDLLEQNESWAKDDKRSRHLAVASR